MSVYGTYSRRESPVADTSWHARARCNADDVDDTLFFHPYGERGAPKQRRAEQAKAICQACPVMETCREESLRVREQHGTWGGLSEDERKSLLRKQQRARKKAEVAA